MGNEGRHGLLPNPSLPPKRATPSAYHSPALRSGPLLPSKITRPHELISPIVIFRACPPPPPSREVCLSKKPRRLRRSETQTSSLSLLHSREEPPTQSVVGGQRNQLPISPPSLGNLPTNQWRARQSVAEITPPPFNSARNNHSSLFSSSNPRSVFPPVNQSALRPLFKPLTRSGHAIKRRRRKRRERRRGGQSDWLRRKWRRNDGRPP